MDRGFGIPDCHVHSRYSDGHDGLDACAEHALALGLPELGFAEHLAPRCLGVMGDYGIDQTRLDEYVAAVRGTAARYPELRLLCGVEADYVPEGVDEVAALLAAHPLDYVLCSVHFVDGFNFNYAANRDAPGWQDPDCVFRRYWELLREAAQTGLFTAVAHPDLPKRWGHRQAEDLGELEDEAFAAVAAAGMAIEINTSGLDRHPVAEMYPAANLLGRAHAAGIALTFGSDAHHAADVGSHFSEAVQLAHSAGYESWLRLSDRESVALP
jgi:histidinol-phosphatase (PHP family)